MVEDYGIPRDSIGDKMYKSISHLIETQAPLNWKQLTKTRFIN